MVQVMALKMQALSSLAFSVPIDHSTWCNVSEDLNLQYYGDFICYVILHKNTATLYYKSNIFTIPCNMFQTGRSPSGENGKKM